jgi:DNA (cytosine-5)-methyltransferase 1
VEAKPEYCHRKKHVFFVDAFAGCGGLSLGLFQAGLTGVFAIEHDKFAFETLRTNLLAQRAKYRFVWPQWLPKEPISISSLLDAYQPHVEALEGTIDLLVGGPPCQGFSSAGRRRHDDPRNRLYKSYLELVHLLKPKAVLIENVRGFTVNFERGDKIHNYSKDLRKTLSQTYTVHEKILDVSEFGVPQHRKRYFLLALAPELAASHPFEELRERLPSFLRSLSIHAPVSSQAAISDLELSRNGRRASVDTPHFEEIDFTTVPLTSYQKHLRKLSRKTSDLRLARHAEHISARFAEIIRISHAEGRLNTTISEDLRKHYGLQKRALRVLDPDQPAPTVTSMPDDLLHYAEPRTLTVRENARLQSFPDWYAFKGKYTTGGDLRRREVPRFTQVANAVPPLVARAIGEYLSELLRSAETVRDSSRTGL